MSAVFTAIFPVFALLVLGNIARRSGFLDEHFWRQAEQGTYYVLFPCLLLANLVRAELDWLAAGLLAVAAALLIVTASVLALLFNVWLKLSGPDFTSFFQGTTRFNTFIGLALAAVLPDPALTYAALIIAGMIPLVNVFCVVAFAVYTPATLRIRTVIMQVVKNPLVVVSVLGIVLNLLGWLPPVLVMTVVDKLALMALPVGLLAVGAGLRLQALRGAGHTFGWVVLAKLAILPVLIWYLAAALGLDNDAQRVLTLFAALPTAASAYILARQLGGNAELMAGIITGQTLLAMASLPLVMYLTA
ncbi:MAG: AEC family transporter [Thiolinea sp.]